MITAIKRYFGARCLTKYQCKFGSSLDSLGKNCELVLESHVKLGRVLVKGRHHSIGAYSYIRSGSELYGNCEIGRFCSIGSNVVIGLEKNKHPISWLTTSLFSKELEQKYEAQVPVLNTFIGNDCWIGRDVLIMGGVKIGDGAIIAARAVVTSDVPAYAIYAGIPAKKIKYRFNSELIQKLLISKWWNVSAEILKNLNLDEPALCLDKLENQKPASYKKLLLTRNGVRITN
ncbi:MAG: CatB-related O-acetyltransferase [Methylotenera sp.]